MARLCITALCTLTLTALPFPSEVNADEVDPWRMVFRQTAPFAFSSLNNWAQAQSLNPTNHTSDNFSILNQLESFRTSDGKLTFERFAACLEIDGTGKAMQLVGKLARGGYGRNQFVQTAGTGGGIG